MPKLNPPGGRDIRNALQAALDTRGGVGAWSWERESGRARADIYVALLFGVDPIEAAAGLPVAAYVAGIHSSDRRQVLALCREAARKGRTHLSEFRVRSADGITRHVLTRSRFLCNHLGEAVGGHGIIVDITRLRSDGDDRDLDPPVADRAAAPLDRAAEAGIAAYRAIGVTHDPELIARAEALLFQIGRRLAAQEQDERRSRLN